MSNLESIPALVPAPGGALLAFADATSRLCQLDEARALFRSGDVLVANTAFVAGRLRTAPAKPLFDVLELLVFVRPNLPFVPSALGLARAMGLSMASAPDEPLRALRESAERLLQELADFPEAERKRLQPLAQLLASAGWRWGPSVVAAVGECERAGASLSALAAWQSLEEWEDEAPPSKPSSQPVGSEETRRRLERLIGTAGEARLEQSAYADAATHAFGSRARAGAPKIALLEAGTGIGKTLGYLAPASLWAEKNGPGLWLSTYTRNLQRQIVQEIARLYPDPAERDDKAVVRKGRENYVCLLNFEDAARRSLLAQGQRLVALGLIARWIMTRSDGDVSGAGFPSFLAAALPVREITDRRGECIYSACPHYRVCFIERAVRRSRHTPIVVANHALVIAQAAQDWNPEQESAGERRVRYVFDEGHHLFEAADSGFAVHLCGREMAELRRWIIGPEARSRGSRARGLEERLRDIVEGDPELRAFVLETKTAAGALAAEGAMSRIVNAAARNPGEAFLASVYAHVQARSSDIDPLYSREAETAPLGAELRGAAHELSESLGAIARPMLALSSGLRRKLDRQAGELETRERARLEGAARGLERRAKQILPAWIAMLDILTAGTAEKEFVDWFEIARDDGRDIDVGLRRHWIDPTIPFSSDVLSAAHGALITSATLRDVESDADDWQSAEVRTGAHHLPEPPKRASFGSPFRYADQVRIFVVSDIERRDPAQLASAYRELFLASGGGALGLFTSVRMLRAVEEQIAAPLADAGLTLYAQHVDRLDAGTLVDLFRAEENACVLGTDALRDGVDVPGRSLRLVVFDKVPWPRPTILHKARRERFGRGYDDLLTRLRLKQAFGRLIRSQSDKGCFAILESATPSRLMSAFPREAPIKRCGLADAVGKIKAFLA